MTYEVSISNRAMKALVKIPEPYYSKLKTAIYNLAKNPRPMVFKKLKARDAFRIRVADYRIIYEINDGVLSVEVINLGHRRGVYS